MRPHEHVSITFDWEQSCDGCNWFANTFTFHVLERPQLIFILFIPLEMSYLVRPGQKVIAKSWVSLISIIALWAAWKNIRRRIERVSAVWRGKWRQYGSGFNCTQTRFEFDLYGNSTRQSRRTRMMHYVTIQYSVFRITASFFLTLCTFVKTRLCNSCQVNGLKTNLFDSNTWQERKLSSSTKVISCCGSCNQLLHTWYRVPKSFSLCKAAHS